MNHALFPTPDPKEERRRALAKIYSLLIRLAEELEEKAKEADENLVLLKSNIPVGQ